MSAYSAMLPFVINHLPDSPLGTFYRKGCFLRDQPASAALHKLPLAPRPCLDRSPSGSTPRRTEHLGTDSRGRVAAFTLKAVTLLAALEKRRPSHPLVLDPVLEVLILADGRGGDDDSRRLLRSLRKATWSQAMRSRT